MQPSELQAFTAQSALQKPKLLPSPGFGAWLYQQHASLVFTTYQSGRIFFVSGAPDGSVVALERVVGSAMGVAASRDVLWVGNKDNIWRFCNVGGISMPGANSELSHNQYDAVYVPRQGMAIGGCDTHDLLADVEYQGTRYEVMFVNTSFSCIATIDNHYSFIPVWKPSFISSLGAGDRCHLNGMGMRDGQLAYATACAETDQPGAWRAHKAGGGILIDVASGDIISHGLSMPHSPRWYDNRVWLLNSGEGQLGYAEPESGEFRPVADCPGFARGLCFSGRHAIVGLSRLRNNTLSSGLKLSARLEQQRVPQQCGLLVVNIDSGQTEHWLTLDGSVTELYDVTLLPGICNPFTPGFSNPKQSRNLINIPNDRFRLELAQDANSPELN